MSDDTGRSNQVFSCIDDGSWRKLIQDSVDQNGAHKNIGRGSYKAKRCNLFMYLSNYIYNNTRNLILMFFVQQSSLLVRFMLVLSALRSFDAPEKIIVRSTMIEAIKFSP